MSKRTLACKEFLEGYTRKEEEMHLPLRLRLRIFLHKLVCPACRRFINQYKLILNGIRLYRESRPVHQLDPEKKQRLQEQLDKLS